ncbi:hypothetical protein ERO13_D04G005900v2 [Gossypium hirsutum]|uniref:BZIP transcription factor 60 n=1 Tax=Gossypium hirsutum TaxID=3635 RepID=A0A1U8JBP1_GOSHI|nr:bZIP transcription factor 60-like [Gossypium hirsutum]KAG4150465.1 hypothetical protein ERO13_D04G005900v2 [Gossypium hirsutum]
MEETNWESLLFEFDCPNLGNILQNESESVTPPISTHSPDEKPIWTSSIGEIEKLLMEDDRFDDKVETQPIPNEFLADLLVDSSPSGCGDEVIDDTAFDKQNQTLFNVDNDDPIDKKQRRKLRNRDAAVRSRERKKMYVKDLEMKSRYLEGECRRLNCLLQWSIAENQALRFTLNQRCAFDASSAKQESAVLLLESLLLGSLLWFLGIMCLFTLPRLPKSLLENEEKRGPERVAHSNLVGQSFAKTRRCKASKTKMKDFMFLEFQFHFRLGDDERVSLSYKMTSGGGSHFVS